MKKFLGRLSKWLLIFYRIGLASGLFAGTVYMVWRIAQILGHYVLKPVLEWLVYLCPPYSKLLVVSAISALLIWGIVWSIRSEITNRRERQRLRMEQEVQDKRDRAAAAELFPRLPQMYPQAGLQQDENGNLFLPFHAEGKGLFLYQDQWAAVTIGIDEDTQHISLNDRDGVSLEEQASRTLEDIMAGRLVLAAAEDETGYLRHTDICSPSQAEQCLTKWGQLPESPSFFIRCCRALFLIKPKLPHKISIGRVLTWDGSGDKTVHFE